MAEDIVIGIIGAGENTRVKHIPNLKKLKGVKIHAVCNRRPESTARAAREFGIPKTYEHWEQVIEDPDVNAILIGTWPYLHCPATLAALAAGKHTLTEARMAMNAEEAHKMRAAALEHPDIVSMIVPSPVGLKGDYVMRRLIAGGHLGELREVVARCFTGSDPAAPLHWRQQRRYSGLNIMTLGIYHETLLRWLPAPRRVRALAHTFVAKRRDPETGRETEVDAPDSVKVLTEIEGGAQGAYLFSGAAFNCPFNGFELYGSRGTIIYDAGREQIRIAAAGDNELREAPIPPDKAREWTVEADFVAAIRGEKEVELTTFDDGVRYMDFTEAAHRSAATGNPVDLPLKM